MLGVSQHKHPLILKPIAEEETRITRFPKGNLQKPKLPEKKKTKRGCYMTSYTVCQRAARVTVLNTSDPHRVQS